MKKLLVLFCGAMMVFTTPALAQVTFGLRGGLNLANSDISSITAASVQSEDSYTGFFFGPALEFQVPIIGIGIDGAVMYSQSGLKLSKEKDIKEQFIAVPVSLKGRFGIGNMLAVLVHVGPQFDFNIGDTEVLIQSSGDISRFTQEKVTTSLNLGAGVRLLNKFDVEVNYNIPLKDKSHYEKYQTGTTMENYKNAATDIDDAISQKTLQVALTYRF